MTISVTSDSRGYTLAQAADGTLSVSAQEAGLVKGLTSELTGMLNGGETGSVGMSHTVAEVAKVGAGVAIANKTSFTQSWPVIGQPG